MGLGIVTESLVWHGDRGIGAGGYHTTTPVDEIIYKAVTSSGDTSDFGDLSVVSTSPMALSDSARMVHSMSAYNNDDFTSNVLEYVTISSTGDSQDYGDLSVGRAYAGTSTNGITGLFAGGYEGTTARSRVIDYIAIGTLGNATDFGDLIAPGAQIKAGVCNTVRGVWGGGYQTSDTPSSMREIDYVTIASTGDASDFGDLTTDKNQSAAVESSTRGVWWSGRKETGHNTTNIENIIDYITVASTGDASDFGDQAVAGDVAFNGMGNLTRGEKWGGSDPSGSWSSNIDTIQYITIASTGDSTDAGNLETATGWGPSGCSGT